MHDDAYIGGRSENNQTTRFCRVTGFMSDFHSFIVVEFIQFFRRALQMCLSLSGRHLNDIISYLSEINS